MANILVVDDEPLISMMIEDWVVDLGHKPVGPAQSLNAALALVASTDIDGAIIDVSLGRESGYPLAKVLAERGIPFAFATGHSAAAIERGHSAVAVLVKPFGLNSFQAAIEAIVSSRNTPAGHLPANTQVVFAAG